MKKAPWLKPAVMVGGLSPLVLMALRALRGQLTADPVAYALNQFGLLALIFLWLCLCCTPLKTSFGWVWPNHLRRMLGNFSFFYAALHFSTYFFVDQGMKLRAILEDIAKRPFIMLGSAAFLCLLPLALTSTNASVRRLGYAKWKRLHRLIYPAAIFASVHFILRVKADLRQPLTYASILAVLFAVRLVTFVRKS